MRSKIVVGIILFSALFSCSTSYAQVSLKASMLVPRADLGAHFKKTIAPELSFLVVKERWRARFTFTYARLTPRSDSFPIYYEASPNIIPGTLVYQPMPMYYLRGDFSFAFVKYKNFSLWGGSGFITGAAFQSYQERYNGMNTETIDITQVLVGLPLVATLQYQVNKHLDVFAEVVNNRVMASDLDTHLQHNTYSIGANYFVKERGKKKKGKKSKSKSSTWF